MTAIFSQIKSDDVSEQDVWNYISRGYNLNFRPPTKDGHPLYITANYRLVNLISVVITLNMIEVNDP